MIRLTRDVPDLKVEVCQLRRPIGLSSGKLLRVPIINQVTVIRCSVDDASTNEICNATQFRSGSEGGTERNVCGTGSGSDRIGTHTAHLLDQDRTFANRSGLSHIISTLLFLKSYYATDQPCPNSSRTTHLTSLELPSTVQDNATTSATRLTLGIVARPQLQQ